MKYEDIIDDEKQPSKVQESMPVYSSQTPVMSLDSLYGMIQPLDRKSKMWLIDKLCADVDRDVHDYARRICSDAEYNELKNEGFLDNPTSIQEPSTQAELLSEVKDFHASGYLSAEDTQKWFEDLVS